MPSFAQRVELLPGELWWGGAVSDGIHMPFGRDTFTRSLDPNQTVNQATPLLVSNKGRFIWSEHPFTFTFSDGFLELNCPHGPIIVEENHGSLRQAYQAAQKSYFPPKDLLPEPLLFTAPQYNTWIELMYDQREEKILRYAEAIVEKGMPTGVLMIDDTWQEDYGVWEFHGARFSDPKGMIDRLHELGFKVMLWTCPFVSPDSAVFRELDERGLLIKNSRGETAIRRWWNGYSAVLDLTNEECVAWFRQQLERLMNDYGVDGFKFDGGDPMYYRADDLCARQVHPNDQAEIWARLGLDYTLNEYRACWKCAGEPLAQRLADKVHSWGTDGLASLIPNGLAQGLLGYAFTCPDMIGGGEYKTFLEQSANLDQELLVRYAQCSALFPMMQFSAAPWRVLDEEHFGYCLEAARLHAELGSEILDIARHAARTGEPIIRHLAYSFPDEGYEMVNDQFMLGDDILVAPVVEKGARTRKVHFPTGKWLGDDGSVVEGPCVQEVDAPLSRLPWYRRVK